LLDSGLTLSEISRDHLEYAKGLQILHVAQLRRGLKTRWRVETAQADRVTDALMSEAQHLDPDTLFEESLK
jgi:hypothetical protein